MTVEKYEGIELPKPKADATLPILLEEKRAELKKLRKELSVVLELLNK